MTCEELTQCIESLFPPIFQEKWDNSGWNLLLHPKKIHGVYVCVDITMSVAQAAAARGCEVIISHHPLLFSGIKRIDSLKGKGVLLDYLMRHGISVYCAHTSADNSPQGINMGLAGLFGLKGARILECGDVSLYKIAVTAPVDAAANVRKALFSSGAGALGAYRDCAFSMRGMGTFAGNDDAKPYIGAPGEHVELEEERVEVLCSAENLKSACDSVALVHPYEMPAIDIYPLAEHNPGIGSGAFGTLEDPMTLRALAQLVKEKLDIPCVRMHGDGEKQIRNVALCGGAGGDFISSAVSQDADVFISGELKHNMFCDFQIPLLEVGHYASEKIFESIVFEALHNADSVLESSTGIFLSNGLDCPYIDI